MKGIYRIFINDKLITEKENLVLFNFKFFLAGFLSRINSTSGPVFSIISNFRNIDGVNITNITFDGLNSNFIFAGAGLGNIFLHLGNGSTAPNFYDFKLGNFLEELTASFRNVTYESNIYKIFLRFTKTYTSSFTFRELGLVYNITRTDGSITKVMFTRDVLPNPITINAGQTLTIEYEIQI